MRGLVRACAQQEVRLMELDFQPRRKYRVWESMWNQIVMMVDRHCYSSPVCPVTKVQPGTSLMSARDPETGLDKPDAPLPINQAP